MSRFEPPEEVMRRVRMRGEEGAAWLAALDGQLRELARAWDLTLGPVLSGGSGALVLEAKTAAGVDAVLKLPLPWLAPERSEAQVLRAAAGRGYVALLREGESSGAMLLERLGPRLSTLGLSIEAQLQALCATLTQAWIRDAEASSFLAGDAKALALAAFVETTWRALGRPCSDRVIERALHFAQQRRAAFDPERSVLAHGDAHEENLLLAGSALAATPVSPTPASFPLSFKLIDPEGLFIEPAYDLSAAMRGWSAELLAGDALELGRARCRLLAQLTKLETDAVWQWGFLERVSTGLHLLELGWDVEGRDLLTVAEAWAVGER